MLDVTVVSNSYQPLREILSSELMEADGFQAASAFLNSGGLEVIKPGLEKILENEGRVRIVHGADFRITDPQAMRDLVDMKMRYVNMSYLVHCDWWLTIYHSFHPKLYITTADYLNYCAIVGSSNLTRGGMLENVEVNTVIRGSHSEEPVSQCLNIFESIVKNVALLQPDLTFVEKYEYLHENAKRLSLYQEPSAELADVYQQLIALQSTINEDWRPHTQSEFIIKAMENLSEGDPDKFLGLSSIYKEAERLARSSGERYRWDTFSNSVRGRLNDNVVGRYGRDLFERRGGVTGRYGQYRLSEKGRDYGKNKVKSSDYS